MDSSEFLFRVFFSLCIGALCFIGGYAGISIEGFTVETVVVAAFAAVLFVVAQLMIWTAP